jgi:cell division protein FtsB
MMRILLTLVAFLALPLPAQQCPDGTYHADTRIEGEVTRIVCKCLPGRTLVSGRCVVGPPSAALSEAIGERVAQLEEEIGRDEHTIAVCRTALRVLQNAQPFNQQFDEWAFESQTAEVEALSAALGLAMGPISAGIAQARRDGVNAWASYQRARPALKTARLALVKYRRVWAKYPELLAQTQALEAEVKLAESMLERSLSYRELAEPLQVLTRRTLATLKLSRLVTKPAEQRDLMAAMGELNRASWELLGGSMIEVAVRELAAGGAEQAAGAARLVKFTSDYGLATTRFGLAWYHIDRLVQAVDDRNALIDELSRRLKESEALRQDCVRQAQHLRDVSTAPTPEQQQALAESRARELVAAYTAGEWFSASTGFRAPGEPIR